MKRYRLSKCRKNCKNCKHHFGWMNLFETNEMPCCDLDSFQNDIEFVTGECPNFKEVKSKEVKE